jgi:hypothetical protein
MDPEHDAKVQAGLAAIVKTESSYAEDGKITRQGAETVAAIVKKAHPVFNQITIADTGQAWSYEYVASPAEKGHETPKQEETRVVRAYHGTEGDNILGIMASGTMNPGVGGGVYLVKGGDYSKGFMHGVDRGRKASFVIEVELTFDTSKVKQKAEWTHGVPDAWLLTTSEPVPAKVLKLFIRKKGGEPGEFEFDQREGEEAIKEYLKRGQ